MTRVFLILFLSLIVVATAAVQTREERALVKIPMRDGIKLSTLVVRPSIPGRIPALLVRTPYGKGSDLIANHRFFVEQGFAVIVQDVRGRHDSEGAFKPLEQEQPDGFDTIEWIARQPWSNGRVGMMGGSYLGFTQWQAAMSGNPHLRAIFPVVAGSDEYLDRFYSPGGVMKLGHRLLWMNENLRVPGFQADFETYTRHLPLRTADAAATGRTVEYYQRALAHPSYDQYWKLLSIRRQSSRIKAPAFSVAGWYDNYAQGDLEIFSQLSRSNRAQHIVVGAWPHNMSMPLTGLELGKELGAPIRRYQLEWFTHWLKDDHPSPDGPEVPPMRIFVMGANKWRDEREWPIARTRYTPFYLSGRGDANTAKGDGALTSEPQKGDVPDEYTYDPRKPVPTQGGSVCCNPKIFAWGPRDQTSIESRADVLVYTSAPLKQELEVTGTVRAVLYVATSAPDTDFTAKLVMVQPDGQTRNLTDGILRLRYRNTLESPELARPREVYAITIDCGVTSYQFKPGQRIRLEVSSSNFPRFERNPNTGRPVADEKELRTAQQTVHHGRQYPSHLLLPVIP